MQEVCQGKEFYDAALKTEKENPRNALELLYQAHLLGYTRATHRLYKSPLENIEVVNHSINFEAKKVDDLFYEGLQLLTGIGVGHRNNSGAAQYFEAAANKGYPDAQNILGWMYEFGVGVKKDITLAVKFYSLAAREEFAEAQYNMGALYKNGEGVPQSDQQAVACYMQAAIKDHAGALNALGWHYANGVGVKKNNTIAMEYYQRAAEKGCVRAQANLGSGYEKINNVEKAFYWYTQAANQDHAGAQSALGWLYENGQGVSKDLKKAEKLYLRAAHQGYATAQYNVALLYKRRGELDAALLWMRRSVAQHYSPAINILKEMYLYNEILFKAEDAKIYRQDFQHLNLSLFHSITYLNKMKSSKEFPVKYQAAMIEGKAVQYGLCDSEPSKFFKEFIKDKLLSDNERNEWFNYFLTHHFASLNPSEQLELAQKIYGSARHFSPHVMELLITAFNTILLDPAAEANVAQIHADLAHLHNLHGNKRLSRYHMKKSMEIDENIVGDMNDFVMQNCNAEVLLSDEGLKAWIEKALSIPEDETSHLSAAQRVKLSFELAELYYAEGKQNVFAEEDKLLNFMGNIPLCLTNVKLFFEQFITLTQLMNEFKLDEIQENLVLDKVMQRINDPEKKVHADILQWSANQKEAMAMEIAVETVVNNPVVRSPVFSRAVSPVLPDVSVKRNVSSRQMVCE